MPFRTRQQEVVAQFHRVMRAPAPAQPTPLPPDRAELRTRLIDEEAAEFAVADPFGNRLVPLDMSRGPLTTDAAGNVVEHSTAADGAGPTTGE